MQMTDAQQRKFVFREALGQGGFGEVYLADMQAPSGLTSSVAVKVLHGGLDPASQAVRRLTDEGKILSMLNHPCIVAVHDLAIIDGRVALVTEFVEGADLPDCLVGQNPMPPKAIYEAIGRVADALHAAHKATDADGSDLGLLHRDVKPRNVRVGKHGQVKLLDFGIATASGLSREAQTGTNALIGSFPYMAPERFTRKPMGPESDIYSLGCTLFEMLVPGAEKLFPQEDVAELLVPKTVPAGNATFLAEQMAKLSDQPAELHTLLLEMVDLDPSKRPTAPEVVGRLEDLADSATGASLARWARSRDWGTTKGESGTLTGKVIVETGAGTAVLPNIANTMHIDLDELEPAPSNVKRGLGVALLFFVGLALFAMVLFITIFIGYQVTSGPTPTDQWVGVPQPTDQKVVNVVTPSDVPTTTDSLAATDGPEPTPVDGPEPTEPLVEPTDAPDVANNTVIGEGPSPTGTNDPEKDPVPDPVPAGPPDDAATATADVCGAMVGLETSAASGRLNNDTRACLSRYARSSSMKQTERIKLGRLMLMDAQARCKAGKGCADYEREQPWYFEELEQSDPDMLMAWAMHTRSKGRNVEARQYVRKALSRKERWTGARRISRLDTLYRLDALAAADIWKANHKSDDLRNRAKESAANWANFRARVSKDTSEAMQLCVAAAGSVGPCNSRVHDNAAKMKMVFTSDPAGATLLIDGVAVGSTPKPMELSFGTHRVEMTTADGGRIQREIEVGTEAPKRWTWIVENSEWKSAF